MFGIIIAMPSEARCFSSSFREIGTLYKHGSNALVVVSGMGEQALAAATLLCEKGVSCLISCGSAVGLAPHLKPGTLCIPKQVLHANGEICYSDPWLRKKVGEAFNNKILITEENLIHAPLVLKKTSEKNRLYQESGAIAADMESYYVGKEATLHEIPFLALRVILDVAKFHMPDAIGNCISGEGNVNLKQLLWDLYRQPSLLMPLMILAKNYNKTRHVLKEVAQLDLFRAAALS